MADALDKNIIDKDEYLQTAEIEVCEVPLEGDALGLQLQDLRKYSDENTIGVVATLGVTFTGIYEPVAALARELDAMQRDLV